MWLLLLVSCAPWSVSDLDRDGYVAPDDCDDGDAQIHPGRRDPWGDGVDSNCDGLDGVDADGDGVPVIGATGEEDCNDDDPEVTLATLLYRDGDKDGFGVGGGQAFCEPPPVRPDQPPEWVELSGDCNDRDRAVYPGAPEPCGVRDLNCDAIVARCEPLQGELRSDARVDGPSVGSGFGTQLAAVGDVDGDGWEDLVVGTPDLSMAWILGAPFEPADTAAGSTRIALSGTGSDRAGSAVAPVGDIDRDGLQDVLIGAEHDDLGDTDAGAAWLLFGVDGVGPDGATDTLSGTLSSQALHLVGVDEGDHAGAAVAGPGDVNGDRTPDLLIGAPDRGVGGSAWLVSGDFQQNQSLRSAELELVGPVGARAGSVLAGGDLNGDGLGELIVGSPEVDAVWVVQGGSWSPSTTLDLDQAHGVLVGRAGTEFAASLLVSDADGDGYQDLWVGAPGEDEGAGAAWLFDAKTAVGVGDPVAAASVVGSDRLGSAITRIPERYSGGWTELVLAGTDQVWLFRDLRVGANDLSDASAWIEGVPGEGVGTSITGGDWNRDGVGDLAVGAPGAGSGAILLYYGD